MDMKFLRRFFSRVQQVSLITFVWFVMMGCLYGMYQLVFERSLFIVKNIEVDGRLVHLSSDDIKTYSGIKLGDNLFSADLKKIQKSVAANPWVLEVAVSRKIPSTIWIYVNEHVPAALLAADEVYMIDEEGDIFKDLDGMDEKNLPILTGLSRNSDIGASMRLLNTYRKSSLANYFEPEEINFERARGYSVVISNIVVRLGFDEFESKLEFLYSMFSAISSYNGNKIRYVDLNMPGKAVVKYDG
ncbi:MAG: hypothetical protein A3I09_02975 [Deltaproteobacteria bacterium RIFCSPLOWO2_02_FULL_47_10]|nr:MAG: hypothetical protein A3I09_02975 [Deltaproteobacteria bacterium RIFCSPLOWO2_02_FULL_47_10]